MSEPSPCSCPPILGCPQAGLDGCIQIDVLEGERVAGAKDVLNEIKRIPAETNELSGETRDWLVRYLETVLFGAPE